MKFKTLHPWNLNPAQAIRVQNELRQKIKLKRCFTKPKLIAGADVAFERGQATAAVVVLDYAEFSRQSSNARREDTALAGKIIEQARYTARISYPYIPGLLTFREGPVLEKCFKALKNEPDVIIFDGQGLAHPRSMGIATHMGILLDKPTVGCAKTRLYGKYTEPGKLRGAFSYLFDRNRKQIGAVLMTRDFVKPVYVSAGYKMDTRSAINIILQCTGRYRIPEPLRLAHQLTRQRL